MENDAVDVKWINALISLIKDIIDKVPADHPAKSHWERTTAFMAKKAEEDPRYQTIDLSK